MIPIILAGLALASSIAGAAVQGSALGKQQKNLDRQLLDLEKWYKSSRSEDLADSSAIRNTLRNHKAQIKRINKEDQARVSKGELSTESAITKASAANQDFGTLISSIAKNDTQNRREIENTYLSRATDLYNDINSVYKGKVALASNTVGDIFSIADKYSQRLKR